VTRAAAFGVASSGQLFARVLHAAPKLKLRGEQTAMLADTCGMYTADSDEVFRDMGESARDLRDRVYAPTVLSSDEISAVWEIADKRVKQFRKLEHDWILLTLQGLAELDPEQREMLSRLHGAGWKYSAETHIGAVSETA